MRLTNRLPQFGQVHRGRSAFRRGRSRGRPRTWSTARATPFARDWGVRASSSKRRSWRRLEGESASKTGRACWAASVAARSSEGVTSSSRVGRRSKRTRAADADARGAPHAAVDVQPLAFAAHRDERGVDRDAVEGAYDPVASGGGVGGEGAGDAFGDVHVGVRPLLVERPASNEAAGASSSLAVTGRVCGSPLAQALRLTRESLKHSLTLSAAPSSILPRKRGRRSILRCRGLPCLRAASSGCC